MGVIGDLVLVVAGESLPDFPKDGTGVTGRSFEVQLC